MGVRLADILIDVAAGRADGSHANTPIGRYRVWFPVGTPIPMLGLYKLFMAPPGFGVSYLLPWLLVSVSGIFDGLSRRSPPGAHRLATRYHERSRTVRHADATVGVVGAIGVLMISILAKRFGLTEATSVPAMGVDDDHRPSADRFPGRVC